LLGSPTSNFYPNETKVEFRAEKFRAGGKNLEEIFSRWLGTDFGSVYKKRTYKTLKGTKIIRKSKRFI